jgi:catechol 2,3-dioxygenase-like lactoylglutathione lyase family enzyme
MTGSGSDVDHIALGVQDLDERIAFFTTGLGMVVRRRGTQFSTGSRLAMLGYPGVSFKLELIESTAERGLLHVAHRVDNLQEAYNRLLATGLRSIRGPHRLEAAKAETALLDDPAGPQLQIIQYDPDSPDL